MHPLLLIAGAAVAALATVFFSTLTYGLRDLVRARLAAYFDKFGGGAEWLDLTVDKRSDLILVTAALRLAANTLLLIFVLQLFLDAGWPRWAELTGAVVVTWVLGMFFSVALPHALARYAGETLIGQSVRFLHLVRRVFWPAVRVMNGVETLVRKAVGAAAVQEPEAQLEQEILSVVEEGEKEGIVDKQERVMIESVISFRDTTVGQIMTARPEIVGLDIGSTLSHVKATIDESGHSRLPVYNGTLDQIVGVLYVRDLLSFVGEPPEKFDLKAAMRPPLFVPETKPLRDLLSDFRLQKVHVAIVSDEYGGTAGLVSIEDLLEEIVGDISDEHEPAEPAMLRKLDDQTWEADARVYLDELNRVVGLNLPEEAGYDTLGGFVSTTLGKIPADGTVFEHDHVRYTILDAEPQKVNRVKLELLAAPVAGAAAAAAAAEAPGVASPS